MKCCWGNGRFSAPTPAGTITQILHAPLPDLTAVRPDIPEALADLLYRMLAKNKSDRIPSVRLVGAELEAILQETAGQSEAAPSGPPPSRRPAFATPTPERMMRARHNLPAQTTPFIGRESELVELEQLLADPATRLAPPHAGAGMVTAVLRVDFALDSDALPQVTRICRLAEGMPLGIVLAAAWVDMLSLSEIADEMQADIDFLASEMGDLPPRQRSMRAVFDYSWHMLTENEQQLLAGLNDGAWS